MCIKKTPKSSYLLENTHLRYTSHRTLHYSLLAIDPDASPSPYRGKPDPFDPRLDSWSLCVHVTLDAHATASRFDLDYSCLSFWNRMRQCNVRSKTLECVKWQ